VDFCVTKCESEMSLFFSGRPASEDSEPDIHDSALTTFVIPPILI